MWAVLGDIEFELHNQPGGQSERTSVDFAEHALIQSKPRLEHVADALDELTLEILLHGALLDPEMQIRRLKTAMAAHQPLAYVLGSGDYRGVYLLTNVDTTSRKTTAQGSLWVATVNLTLREYAGQYEKPRPIPKGLINNLIAHPAAQTSAIPPAGTVAQQALGMARKAGSLLRTGLSGFNTVKSIEDDPLAMLDQVPRLVSMAGQVLPPLVGLKAMGEQMAGGNDLVQLAITVASDVRLAQRRLDPPSPGTIVEQIESATKQMDQAMTRMNVAAPRLARLAADIMTRRV